MPIEGKATRAGTERYAQRHPQLQYRPLGPGQVSPVGFGGYRIDVAVAEHHDALTHALRQGINLIDTSANYSDGRSEELISRVVGGLIEADQLRRDEIVIVTKGGYIQGTNFKHSQQRRQQGVPWPDLVEYMPGLEHCIHPDFLRDQIDRSLTRLNMTHIDVYLLHNPEYYLMQAEKEGVAPDQMAAEFERRLRLAFDSLEQEVARGRISAYGVSANTFVHPDTNAQHVSLHRLLAIAQEIASSHHLQVIQLPLNVYEPHAVTVPNQPAGETTLALAEKRGVDVLVNRPLNAIINDQLVRLSPDGGPVTGAAGNGGPVAGHEEDVSTTVDSLVALEQQLPDILAGQEETLTADVAAYVRQVATAGQMLQANWQAVGNYINWRMFVNNHLLPRLQRTAQILGNNPTLRTATRSWLNEYASIFNAVTRVIDVKYQARAAEWAARERARLVAQVPAWEAPTLSQVAVRAVRSTPGVTCTLVGMRHPDYVADILTELQRPAPPTPAAEWRKFT